MCHERTSCTAANEALGWLFNDLIGADEQDPRDHEAERLGGREVDHQLELRRLPYGSSPGLAPFRILST